MFSWTETLLPTRRAPVQAAQCTKVRIENHRSEVLSCEYHESGKFLLSSNSEGEIQICSVDNAFLVLACLKGHRDGVTEVHYAQDGITLFSSSRDGTIGIWDTFTCTRKTAITGHNNYVNTVQCSPAEGNILCSGSSDGTVRIWDIRQQVCVAGFRSEHAVLSACFSACGRFIFYAGFGNGDIIGWDFRKIEIAHLLAGHSEAVTGLSVSPDGNYLASCSVDGTLRKWDLSSLHAVEEESKSFQLGPSWDQLRRCAWSEDGKMMSAGASNTNVLVFDACSGDVVTELCGHFDVITDVAFHPKRRVIMTAGVDQYLISHNL